MHVDGGVLVPILIILLGLIISVDHRSASAVRSQRTRKGHVGMGFLNRLFGRRAAGDEAPAVDRPRGKDLESDEIDQTSGEQEPTRGRMAAEVNAYHQQRAQALQDDA